MTSDRLYVIRPGFSHEGDGPFYCPGCAEVLGLLEHYPHLKSQVALHFVDFARPRPELIELVGEENQGCPVLVLAEDPGELPEGLDVQRAKGRTFVEGPAAIGAYLARVHGSGKPFLPL